MSFHIITLGCKVNQYESQSIAESLQAGGMEQVSRPALAREIIINSCAVTSRAVRDLKKTCRQAARSSPGARIIVTGCAAQVLEKELSGLKEVHKVISQKDKVLLPAVLLQTQGSMEDTAHYSISDYFRARAVVKVQDGCTHCCTFCIVPRTRGGSTSRQPQDVLHEIKRLISRGFREVILAGINLRLYGRDLSPGMDFWDLLTYLEKNTAPVLNRKFRIRLSSLDPSELGNKALETLEECKSVCPHLHISLQSGSLRVLEKMNRGHYDPQNLMDFSSELKKIWPLYSMGVDVLAGFPGETPQDFEQTMELVQALPVNYAHVFPYSPRPGTPAACFAGQVPHGEKKTRTERLKVLVDLKKKEFMDRLAHQMELDMVMETPHSGMSQYYVECILEKSWSFPPGKMIRVRPVRVLDTKIAVEPMHPDQAKSCPAAGQ